MADRSGERRPTLVDRFLRLFCRHSGDLEFVRNLHGDEIVEHGFKCSVWRCERCGALVYGDELNRKPGG